MKQSVEFESLYYSNSHICIEQGKLSLYYIESKFSCTKLLWNFKEVYKF